MSFVVIITQAFCSAAQRDGSVAVGCPVAGQPVPCHGRAVFCALPKPPSAAQYWPCSLQGLPRRQRLLRGLYVMFDLTLFCFSVVFHFPVWKKALKLLD